MPWIPCLLRGQPVLARCDHDGTLRVEQGRVEIRYRPTDRRAYRASPKNLQRMDPATLLPDEHCVADAALAEPRREPGLLEGEYTEAILASSPQAPTKELSGQHHPRSELGQEQRSDGVTAYADGACSGNPGPAGLGVVIEDQKEKRELSEYLGRATNNVAELTAILRAAEALAQERRPILLKTDSQYAIGVLTKGWKARANPELVAKVKAALGKVPQLTLRYVQGHAGDPGNERADELARAAVTAKTSRGWTTYRKS